jgi:hypothetical protein
VRGDLAYDLWKREGRLRSRPELRVAIMGRAVRRLRSWLMTLTTTLPSRAWGWIRLRVARRGVAAVLLCAFVAVLAAPLLQADEAAGPYCAKGRCCCAPDADDARTCWRTVCRCGGEAGEAVLVSLGPAVLPPRAVAFRLEGHRAALPRGVALPPGPDLGPPDHPPPLP